MSNTIVIELCAEDRARLDRLAEAMERKTCDRCVTTAIQQMEPEVDPAQLTIDDIEAPENAEEAAELSTPTTTPQEEKQMVEEPVTAPTEPTVDRAELRAKVIELSAKGLKEQTRGVVQSYAPTVAAVPEDKVTECYKKLVALEG